MELRLRTLTGRFAVCRFAADAVVPAWAAGSLVSITRTAKELCVVCSEAEVPGGVRAERGWRALEIDGPLNLDLTGVIAALVRPLADARIAVFVLSTYDTDYLLVKEERLASARDVLRRDGHLIAGEDWSGALPSAPRQPGSMDAMKDRMLRGELYLADDPTVQADHARAQELLERYNATQHAEQDEQAALLRSLLGSVGDGVVVRPTFRCDYGTPITIGAGTFVNFDCVMLDVAPITIGAACQIASRVQLLTATHPIDPEPRRRGWEYGRSITLGDNVWLGGGVIVCPGVSVGADTVVGAGAVVTRDLPGGVVAFGAPARVHRTISERDRIVMPEG